MSDIKISALPSAGSAGGTDLVPIVQSGSTLHATIAQLLASGSITIKGPSPWIDVTAPAYGADKTGATDSTTAIQAAVNAAVAGDDIYFPNGTYKITAAINITTAGVTLFGSGPSDNGAIIRQDTYGQPCFEIRGADNVHVRGIKFLNTQPSSVITGTYDGNPARDHACGVYQANSNRTIIEDCRFDGLPEGAHFRGDTTSRANFNVHNKVVNCTFNNLDQGILVEQQDGFQALNITGTNVNATQTVDPHLVYLTGPTSAPFSFNKNCNLANISCNGNTFASAVHVKYAHNTTLNGAAFNNCERGVDGTECHQSTFTNITVTNIAPASGHLGGSDSQQQGIGFSNCNQIRVSNCVVDVTGQDSCRGIADRFDGTLDSQTGLQGCNDNVIADSTVIASYTVANTVGGFHLEGATRCEIRNCHFRTTGDNGQPAVLIRQLASPLTGSTNCIVDSPTVSGTNVAVKVNSSSDTSTRILINRDLLIDNPANPVTDNGTATKTAYLSSQVATYVADQPAYHGSMIEWAYDPIAAQAAAALVSGTLYLWRFVAQTGQTTANVLANVNTLGATLTAATTAAISNCVSNGGPNLIRVTATAHGFSTNDVVTIAGVVGTTEANSAWPITVIDANTFDLVGSVFTHTYTSGGTASRSANACVLYDVNGNFLSATGDQSTTWTTTGMKTMAWAKTVALTPGSVYYAGILSVGTTPPQLARGSTPGLAGASQSGAGSRYTVNGTGLTKLPNTITPASNTTTGAFSIWAGLS